MTRQQSCQGGLGCHQATTKATSRRSCQRMQSASLCAHHVSQLMTSTLWRSPRTLKMTPRHEWLDEDIVADRTVGHKRPQTSAISAPSGVTQLCLVHQSRACCPSPRMLVTCPRSVRLRGRCGDDQPHHCTSVLNRCYTQTNCLQVWL